MSAPMCEKCGSDDIYTDYHKRGCARASCTCSVCSYGSHSKRHDEHLHRHCRGCSFDWTDDVLGVSVVSATQDVPEPTKETDRG